MTRALVLLVVLAGCPSVQKTGGTTTPTSAGAGEGGGGGGGEAAPTGDGKLAVPNLVGKTEDGAKQALAQAGFASELEVNTTPLECDGAAHDDGKVNCQSPDAGTALDKHGLVHVNVYHAQGHPGVLTKTETRRLVGLTLDQAKQQLASMGYHGKIDVAESKDLSSPCKYDTVCEVWPEDFQLDAPITLRVMKAKLEIKSPD